jgi:hypothetical protein
MDPRARLLRLATAVGNRRMAQIARYQGFGTGWYGPPIGGEEDEEELGDITAPPGLDLGFLDAPIPSPPAPETQIAAPVAQHATVAPGPVAQQATVTQLPAPQTAELHAGISDQPAPVAQHSTVLPGPVAQQAAVTQLPAPQTATIHQPAPPPPAVVPVPPPAAAAAAPPSRIAEINPFRDEAQIKSLTRKVDELLGARACIVETGAPYKLPGSKMVTVEVVLTVRERANSPIVVQFVAHYHPGAEKAKVGSAASSQWHIKKWANSEKYYRDEDVKVSTHPNLARIVPKYSDIKRLKLANLPVQGGLRKR